MDCCDNCLRVGLDCSLHETHLRVAENIFFIPIHMASPRGFSHNNPEFPTVSPDNIKRPTYLTRNHAVILIAPPARITCIADHISWSPDILFHLLATLTALIPSDGAVNPFCRRNIHQRFLITIHLNGRKLDRFRRSTRAKHTIVMTTTAVHRALSSRRTRSP